MSTDIHGIVEIWADGSWHLAEPARWEPRGYFGQVDDTNPELVIPILDIPQNYELFAILADVCNVRYPLEPIVPPRGFPDDASEEARQLRSQNYDWMYCASWLRASELFACDWTRTVPTSCGFRTYAQLATRSEHPWEAPLFAEVFPKLRGYGTPASVRVLLFFY